MCQGDSWSSGMALGTWSDTYFTSPQNFETIFLSFNRKNFPKICSHTLAHVQWNSLSELKEFLQVSPMGRWPVLDLGMPRSSLWYHCDVPNSSTVPPPYRSWVLPPYWPSRPIKGPSVYLSILDEYQDWGGRTGRVIWPRLPRSLPSKRKQTNTYKNNE